MIRKLKSGEYRLYSRKKDPKTGKRRNLGTFKSREAAEKHERPCSSSSGRGEWTRATPFVGCGSTPRGPMSCSFPRRGDASPSGTRLA